MLEHVLAQPHRAGNHGAHLRFIIANLTQSPQTGPVVVEHLAASSLQSELLVFFFFAGQELADRQRLEVHWTEHRRLAQPGLDGVVETGMKTCPGTGPSGTGISTSIGPHASERH
jgi:hypothetical protein